MPHQRICFIHYLRWHLDFIPSDHWWDELLAESLRSSGHPFTWSWRWTLVSMSLAHSQALGVDSVGTGQGMLWAGPSPWSRHPIMLLEAGSWLFFNRSIKRVSSHNFGVQGDFLWEFGAHHTTAPCLLATAFESSQADFFFFPNCSGNIKAEPSSVHHPPFVPVWSHGVLWL